MRNELRPYTICTGAAERVERDARPASYPVLVSSWRPYSPARPVKPGTYGAGFSIENYYFCCLICSGDIKITAVKCVR